MPVIERPEVRSTQGTVLTKAVLRAAEKLGLNQAALATVLGRSEATVSRMKRATTFCRPTRKPFELGVLFVRLFRSLDAIVGGDEAVARAWLANPNLALGAKPAEKIRTVAGLMDVIAYLDARTARLNFSPMSTATFGGSSTLNPTFRPGSSSTASPSKTILEGLSKRLSPPSPANAKTLHEVISRPFRYAPYPKDPASVAPALPRRL